MMLLALVNKNSYELNKNIENIQLEINQNSETLILRIIF